MLYQLSYSRMAIDERLYLVGVIGLEPTTSASQTPRATTCATPRHTYYNLSRARRQAGIDYSARPWYNMLLAYSVGLTGPRDYLGPVRVNRRLDPDIEPHRCSALLWAFFR